MNYRTLRVSDFLNTGFKSFSTYDCVINIPNLMDGFKVSQRKAIYTLLAKNKKNTVERYASEIAGYTCYHHGSGSLEGVLVGLAQNFPTSNNVNFLTPFGQFGNILSHFASAGRYISVEPNDNFRKWFRKEDDIVLEYEYEDGEQIEPKYYIPIAPTVLFNGQSGIGTGFACKILNYNPADVVANIKLLLAGKKQKKLVPYYKGYAGDISKEENQTVFTGKFERVSSTNIRITALPIGHDLESYKDVLAKLIDKGEIKDYDDHSTPDGWNILIYAYRSFLENDDDKLRDKLKLITRESENFTLWGEDGKIKTFDSPEALIEYFVKVRLDKYEVRRLKLIDLLDIELDWLNNKLRFVNYYLKNSKEFSNKNKSVMIEMLEKEKFTDIDRLIATPIYTLTKDEIEKLKGKIEEVEGKIKALKATTATEMYRGEIAELTFK